SPERIRRWAGEKRGEGQAVVEYTRAAALQGGEEEREGALGRAAPALRMVLVRNEENLGCAGGNNVAIQYALRRKRPADYVFLLNNDATVEKDCLTHLVEVARRAQAGIVGATILDRNEGTITFGGRTSLLRLFFTPLVSWRLPPPDGHGGYWPSFSGRATGMLIGAETLQAVYAATGEYLESRLFMYAEEEALCYAAAKAGKSTYVASAARVHHRGPRRRERGYNPPAYYYQTRNRVLLARKILPPHWKLLFHLVNGPLVLWATMKRGLRLEGNAALAMLCGLADGYRGISGKWKHHDRWLLCPERKPAGMPPGKKTQG
ncbi:MAG: glycosyltransferase family 2 protein, partial [Candidatus Acidoferrales bacterium]